jgi:hypothetical protein
MNYTWLSYFRAISDSTRHWVPGPNDASDQAALEVLRKCLFQFWQGSFHLFWGSARPPYSKFPALFVALHRRGPAFATLRIDENVGDEAGIFLATLKQTINLCPEWLDIDNWVNLWVSLSFGIIHFFPVRLHVALFYDPKDLKCLATQQTCLAVRYPGSCFHTTQTMHKSRQHMRQLCMRSVCTRRICVQFTLISRNPSKSYVGTGITIPCNNWNATTEIEAQQWEQASISWPHCDCLHPKTKKMILDGLDPSIEYLDPSSFKNVRLRLALLLYLSLFIFIWLLFPRYDLWIPMVTMVYTQSWTGTASGSICQQTPLAPTRDWSWGKAGVLYTFCTLLPGQDVSSI